MACESVARLEEWVVASDGARDDPAETGRRLASRLFEAGAAALAAGMLPDPHDKPPDGIPGAVPTLTTEHQHPTEHVS